MPLCMFWSGCFSLKATGNLCFETGVSLENDTHVMLPRVCFELGWRPSWAPGTGVPVAARDSMC